MKRFLTGLSVVIMLCLVFTSCKKDDSARYPNNVHGIWTGANSSTEYSCDVLFTTNASEGPACEINLVSPNKKTQETFEGWYTYDSSNGTAKFSSDLAGAPTATFQYDESGEVLSVNIKSTSVDYGTYNLTKTTYPSSIAGVWTGETESVKIVATFGGYAINGGVPVEVKFTVGSDPETTVNGTYIYNKETGAMNANIKGISSNVQFNYNAGANMLDGEFAGIVVSLDRIATDK